MAAPKPDTVGPYTIDKAVGKGTFAEVFLGHDESVAFPVTFTTSTHAQISFL